MKCFKCQSPRDVPHNSTTVSGVVKKDNHPTDKKSAPNPVFDLRANSKFISKAEKEKNDMEKYIYIFFLILFFSSKRPYYFDYFPPPLFLTNQPRRVHTNSTSHYYEALRRANRPAPVLLSPSMRKLLEKVLGIKGAASST